MNHRFCLAPMLDWSDRHCRYFWRRMTKHAVLYTEMITTGAILHGDRERYLKFDLDEQPLAVQLGGSEPKDLAKCAKICEQAGFDEINLNIGCPSERVQSGAFGACLMREPELVADCISAMNESVTIPVTIKCRIGVDHDDSYEALLTFIELTANAGCQLFIVHARKAWLSGLSPKQNREIPPLSYPTVYQLKKDFPQIEFILNGGITSLDAAANHLAHVDGVMLGREAYQNPSLLLDVDQRIFSSGNKILNNTLNNTLNNALDCAQSMLPYIEKELNNGTRLHHITRHMLGLFHGQTGARNFRRHLSENAHRPDASAQTLLDALAQLPLNAANG